MGMDVPRSDTMEVGDEIRSFRAVKALPAIKETKKTLTTLFGES